eukprot:jgi/Ulvmu1/11714/UM008_0125.1
MSDVQDPFPNCPTTVGLEVGNSSTSRPAMEERVGTAVDAFSDESSHSNETKPPISQQRHLALTRPANSSSRRQHSRSRMSSTGQATTFSMFSLEKSIIASLIRHESRRSDHGSKSSKASHASSDDRWEHQARPVMFQGVELNSLGCQRYSVEVPPVAALSAQGSICLLAGLYLPLDIFQAQCGTAARTLFTYLTVPALGYHAVCAICILDLMLLDTERWWAEPMLRLVLAAITMEVLVVLQTISLLAAAVAESVPCKADIYKVFLSMEVPALTLVVFVRRLAPVIDCAAAAGLLFFNPFRWWLPNSHAGAAMLLGLLYTVLVSLEALAMYPVLGPAITRSRRRSQRRAHAALLWLLHMNFVLAMCSAYKTRMTVTWLALFQGACLVLYLAWWRALVSRSISEVIDNSDWLLAFIFLRLPAVFAAGMGFWCLGPYDEPWVREEACRAPNWVVHGVSIFADIVVLAFLLLLMFRLTPLGTPPVAAERPSMNGSKGLSTTSPLNSFAMRKKNGSLVDLMSSVPASSASKQASARMLIGQNGALRQHSTQPRAGPHASGSAAGRLARGSKAATGSVNMATFGALLSKDHVLSTSPEPGNTWALASGERLKQTSRRHSTVTFMDQVISDEMDDLATLESSLDIQRHASSQPLGDGKRYEGLAGAAAHACHE